MPAAQAHVPGRALWIVVRIGRSAVDAGIGFGPVAIADMAVTCVAVACVVVACRGVARGGVTCGAVACVVGYLSG